MTQKTRADRIRDLLEAKFAPTRLDIEDQSSRHAGHAGASPAGETHFYVKIESATFMNLTSVARSRAVHSALSEELASGLHALSLRLRAPGEP